MSARVSGLYLVLCVACSCVACSNQALVRGPESESEPPGNANDGSAAGGSEGGGATNDPTTPGPSTPNAPFEEPAPTGSSGASGESGESGAVIPPGAPVTTCVGNFSPVREGEPISITFDRALTETPTIIGALSAETTLSADGRVLTLTPSPGPSWNVGSPVADVVFAIHATSQTGQSSTVYCNYDIVPATTVDYYLRAGAPGDGSREQPFGSIADAFTTIAAAGAPFAVLHVAEGVYAATTPQSLPPLVSVYGGYSSDFSTRNISNQLTTLMAAAAEAGTAQAPVASLGCTNVAGSSVVDGVVVGGATGNGAGDDYRASVDVGPGCDAYFRRLIFLPPAVDAGEHWFAIFSNDAAHAIFSSARIDDDDVQDAIGVDVSGDSSIVFRGSLIRLNADGTGVRIGVSTNALTALAAPKIQRNNLRFTNGDGRIGARMLTATNVAFEHNTIVMENVTNSAALVSDDTVTSVGTEAKLSGSGELRALVDVRADSNGQIVISGDGSCVGVASPAASVVSTRVYVSCPSAVGVAGCAQLDNDIVWSSGTGFVLDGACTAQNATIMATDTAIVTTGAATIQNNILIGANIGVDASVAAPAFFQNNVAYGFTTEYLSGGGALTFTDANSLGAGFARNFTGDPQLIDIDGADDDLTTWLDNDWSVLVKPETCSIREGGRSAVATDIRNFTRSATVICGPDNGGEGVSLGAYEID